MNDKLLALMAKYRLQFQWEDPNETAGELMEPEDDAEPCTLIVTSARGTVWSADFENTEHGRLEALQQFLLEAEETFFGEDEPESDDDEGMDLVGTDAPEESLDAAMDSGNNDPLTIDEED